MLNTLKIDGLAISLIILASCGGGGNSSSDTVTYTNQNNHVTTIAGTPSVNGSADGTGADARFHFPFGVTTDGTNLYVADNGNSTIRKIVTSTGEVTTIAGIAGTRGSADGTGTAATFNLPYGVATDGTNLYVADTYNNTVRKIVISTGEVTTIAGTGAAGSADGTGMAATFSYPTGITTDGTNLYVVDHLNSTVRKIEIATGVVTTIAGIASTRGSADGTGTAATFNLPTGITTDGTNLYLADYGSSTIRKIVISTGAVTTTAGFPGVTGSADGTEVDANFSYPWDVTTDRTYLYVADSNNSTIRKIVISTGAVTTLAGTPGATGSADGTGPAARFYYPSGITTDGTNLYVADTNSHTIRKIY